MVHQCIFVVIFLTLLISYTVTCAVPLIRCCNNNGVVVVGIANFGFASRCNIAQIDLFAMDCLIDVDIFDMVRKSTARANHVVLPVERLTFRLLPNIYLHLSWACQRLTRIFPPVINYIISL